MPDDLFGDIKVFLPKYLSPKEQHDLFEALKQFPNNKNFYLQSKAPADMLQGDGWRGLIAINFETLEKKATSGLILSNSCDIDPSNSRAMDVRILFAPLIRLSNFAQTLEAAGKKADQISDTLATIRAQKVTSIFYLPEFVDVLDESIVLFDDIHAHPLRHFLASTEKARLFTLNQYAFYILVVKLSIHFSRFQEGIAR